MNSKVLLNALVVPLVSAAAILVPTFFPQYHPTTGNWITVAVLYGAGLGITIWQYIKQGDTNGFAYVFFALSPIIFWILIGSGS